MDRRLISPREIDPTLFASLDALLAPAEGLEPSTALFSSSPTGPTETLRELGKIARISLTPPSETETQGTHASFEAAPSASSPTTHTPPPEKNEEQRLIDALLEYHRLRAPSRGARSAVADLPFERVEGSIPPLARAFSSMEIPVVDDYIPKRPNAPFRSEVPTHTVLKRAKPPEPRS